MGLDRGRLKKHATIATSLALVVAFALGVMAFVIALRPCHVSIPAGTLITYQLTTTTAEIGPDNKPGPNQVESRQMQLVGTGGENEVALISPAHDGDPHHAQICLLDLSPDGAAFRLDTAARPMDMGVAVGFFDFNLMPLPAGSEQPRDVSVTYAVLPSTRNPVQGRVRRSKSGSKPIFTLKLQSSVEWRGAGDRYHQIRDLVSTYRFNTSLGVVDHAKIDLIAGVERDDGAHYYQVSMDLELDGPLGHTSENPQHLREEVLTSAEAQELLRSEDHERSSAVAARLRSADIALPQLRSLADRISQAILSPTPAADPIWCLRLAAGPVNEQSEAENLQRRVVAAGFPCHLRTVGEDRLEVVVGPYPSPEPMVLATIARQFPDFSPAWVQTP